LLKAIFKGYSKRAVMHYAFKYFLKNIFLTSNFTTFSIEKEKIGQTEEEI
jgi:hypothetical protein